VTIGRADAQAMNLDYRYLIDGHAPILVQEGPSVEDAPIEVGESDSVYDRIRAVCEALLRSVRAARAVDLVDLQGHVLVRVGDAGDDGKTIERLLADDESPTMPPAGGAGGMGGIPNELRVVEPVPEERPKPKPTPIGRRRKRERYGVTPTIPSCATVA
jgi:hypothetical protein